MGGLVKRGAVMKQKQSVELQIPLQEEMLPVIVCCAENTAQAFGFGKEE